MTIKSMSINESIKDAIKHLGGQAKFSQIIEYVLRQDPTVKPQSIKYALYFGSNKYANKKPTFKKIRRGIYAIA